LDAESLVIDAKRPENTLHHDKLSGAFFRPIWLIYWP
jgi:hypothetical protein